MTRLKYNRDKVYIKDIEELSRMTGIEICHPVNRNYQVLFNGQTVLEEDGRVVY